MRRGLPALFLLATGLAGCGQTHHVLPPAPLRTGEVAAAVHLQWSPGTAAFPLSLGSGIYVGVPGRNVVGGSVSAISLPAALSVAHYEPLPSGAWLALQGHLSNLVDASVMTTLDAVAVVAFPTDAGYQSVRAGVGIVARSPVAGWLVPDDSLRRPAPVVPVPIVGVQLRLRNAVLDAQVRPGLTRTFVRRQHAALQQDSLSVVQALVLTRAEVAGVERDTTWRRTGERAWTVRLVDGDEIRIMPRAPYLHCTGCGLRQAALERYAPTPAHRLYWLRLPARLRPSFDPEGMGLLNAELDMDAVLAEWHRDGVLRLAPRPDDPERAARRVRLPADVSLSLGAAGVPRDPAP